MSDHVHVEREGAVGTVRIDRPDKLNALTSDINTSLREAFDSLDSAEVTAIILTTASDRAFVAGADINEINSLDSAEFIEFQKNGRQTNDTIATHSAVVIAAVSGIAYGGGFELALASDMIVAAENATFATPEVGLGLVPGGGATQRLPRKIGQNRAMELLTTGEPITATEAHDLGLVNRVVPVDDLESEARALAETVTENAPLAVREAKRLVTEGQDMALSSALSHEQEVTFTLFETEDAQEGISAFHEDREPEFTGK